MNEYEQWKQEVEKTKEYDKWNVQQLINQIVENDPMIIKLKQLLKDIKNESRS